MNKVLVIYCLFFCLSTVTLSAQPRSIKRIGIEQGLSNNYIVSIAQDRQGFLWFATESGLNRFDGKKFTRYNRQSGINGNGLNKVYADTHDNIVWIATQRDGLNVFDCQNETFSLFVHNDSDSTSIASDAVTDITNDTAGNVWLATYSNGIDCFNKKTKTFTHYNRSTVPQLVSDNVWAIADDGKGKLYIGHVGAGLSVLSVADKTVKNYRFDKNNPFSLPHDNVRTVFIDKTGNVWIGTDGGLALFNTDTEHFTVFRAETPHATSLQSNVIFSIAQTRDNTLWIGTENGGISILDLRRDMFLSPENVSFQNIYAAEDESGLSYPTVKAIFQDRYDNIWIGTYRGGINFISKFPVFFQKWQHSSSPANNGLPVNAAWGMCEGTDGTIWVGTDGGGICTFKDGVRTGMYSKENRRLNNNAILSALKDSQGNLWFGFFEGNILFYDSRKNRFTPFRPDIFQKAIVRCIYEDDRQTLWFAVDGNGLYSFHPPTNTLKHYTPEKHNIPSDNQVRAVAKDSKGRLWVGSFGAGLNVLDTAFRRIGEFHRESNFYSNAVSCIFRDSKQRIWVGTGEGLAFFPDMDDIQKFVILTEKNGLKDSYVRAITEDKEGNIWLSSNSGISKYNPDENRFYNYDYSNELPIGQFMDGSVVNARNGWLYFGSQNGVCFFNPQKSNDSATPPSVDITGFRYYTATSIPENMENTCPVLPGSVRLKYDQSTFTFSFSVLDCAFANQTEYAYRMRGLSNEWYDIGKTDEVSFRNLPAGTYYFSVRSRLNSRQWSAPTSEFKVAVEPPFWFSWWAKTCYIILITGIVLFFAYFYKKRIQLESQLYVEKENSLHQQTLNNDKLQFFTNITHELRTPLTLIISPLEDLKNDASLSKNVKNKVTLIYQNASRLLELINRILEFRKTETNNLTLRVRKGNIEDLVKEVVFRYKEFNKNDSVTLDFVSETENTILYFDKEVIRIILDNLISNAFKYTQQGNIRVCLRNIREQEISCTEIEVTDTGCGIPASELEKIFERYYQVKRKNQASGTGIGLSLVKNLAAIHDGIILVESEEWCGTSFKFRLKTDHTYPGVLHEETPGAKSENNAETPHATPLPADDKKIMLIAEDNVDILNYIRDMFSENFLVLIADNGKDALEYAFNHIPDIVISDIMMPELSGLELCATLKNDFRTSHIPVILLTAKTSLQDKTMGYETGADSYLTKPFSSDLLRSRVANLIDARKKMVEQIVNSKVFKKTLYSVSINQLDNEFMERITAIVKENCFSENLDIEFIAAKVNMSHASLYRKIKAITGFSINEFVRKIRIKYAEELLLTGKYSISEVAFRIGINNLTYFRKCFREEFGSTPTEYLKKMESGDR